MENEDMADINDREVKIVESAARCLMEHFDTVQVFVTRYEKENTTMLATGFGNWFARHGQVSQWLQREEEGLRCSVRADNEEPEDAT